MRWCWSLLTLFLIANAGLAQEATREILKSAPPEVITEPIAQAAPDNGATPLFPGQGSAATWTDRLAGNHNFDNFIGFMSNPLFNIDPRAVTELYPLTGASWTSTIPALPSGNIWIPPIAGLNVALSERLCLGVNQGGYAVTNFDGNRPGLFRDRFGIIHDRRQFAGQHEGWLNLGGFVQYTVIEDVPSQFLLTSGLRWEAPMGSKAVFQGIGPAHLAPYVTVGKELGDFHVLANLGFDFPTGSGHSTLFYGCVHLDRQMFGWLYPLVEFNWVQHTSHVDVDLPTRHGFVDLGNFTSTGNLVSLAVGANAVLIKNKLEFGGVYTTSIATQHDFNFNGFLVKMVLRY